MADYVIVGAGSAGCVLAGRLSEDPDVEVLLLEAGGPDTAPEVRIPGAWPIMLKSSLDWDLLGEKEPGLGDRRLYLPRGRMLGGSSSINAMIYVRGHRADYDGWAADGCEGWSYDEVLPYFKRSEDNERGEDEFHGVGGPLRVSDGRSMHPLVDAQLEAAVQAGHALLLDLNVDRPEGVGRFQLTQRDGRRWSTADAFLHPAMTRPNLDVRDCAFVERVVFDGDRAAGVEYVRSGVRERAVAEREVILAAGAYQSPVLLMLSGIGPARGARALRDPGAGGPAGRAQHAGPPHGEPELRELGTGDVRHLHPGELRAARKGVARPAHLELPGGGRLLPHPPRPGGAGHRVSLLAVSLLRPGPHRPARRRLRLRPRRREAVVARNGDAPDADGRLQAEGLLQLPHHRGRPGSGHRGRENRPGDGEAARPEGGRARHRSASRPRNPTRTSSPGSAARASPSITRRRRARWAPWSTPSCASTASKGCGSSTRR